MCEGKGKMPSRIDRLETAAGVRYKAIVTIGSGRGAARMTRTEKTEAAAQRAVAHLERVAAGEVPRRDRTVAEVMDGWLEHLEKRGETAPATLARYRQVMASLSTTTIWRRHLAQLQADDIEAAIAGGIGGAETKRLRWRVLRAGIRWGARCWQTADPTPQVRAPKASRPQRVTLDGAGVRALIESVHANALLDPFVLLAATTGKRRNEVLALRVCDVDGDVLHVTRSLEWIDGQPWRLKETKTGQTGDVQMPPLAAERVRVLTKARFHNPNAYLCSLDGGRTPLNPRDVSLAFRAHCDRLGLEDLRVHDLRHSFATILHDSGVSLRDIQAALTHADSRTTMRYEHPQNTMGVVADAIAKAVHGTSVEGASVSEVKR